MKLRNFEMEVFRQTYILSQMTVTSARARCFLSAESIKDVTTLCSHGQIFPG